MHVTYCGVCFDVEGLIQVALLLFPMQWTRVQRWCATFCLWPFVCGLYYSPILLNKTDRDK